jgi:hypothetical protein
MELFEMLQHQKDRAWDDTVTLNESWFYFTTDHEWIWLPEGTEAPEGERITVQSRKMMVTIVWNHTRFDRIIALPKRMKFNPDYYVSQILDSLAEWRSSQVGARVEDCMSTQTMLVLTLRKKLLNSSQAMT